MKFNQKHIALMSAVVGAIMLTTSALADVVIGSGYYGLKSAAKTTSAKLTNEVSNFTVDATITFKVDDTIISTNSTTSKVDISGNQKENFDISMNKGETRESYDYRNAEMIISKHSSSDSYYVYERQDDDFKVMKDIFQEEEAKDIEKIIDAFVGTMQDIIQTEEMDNGKMYIGNITDASVPPLVNAVTSFALKNGMISESEAKRMNIPRPTDNIYLVGASGKAFENQDGILETLIFTASISADDKDGNTHIFSVEFDARISDINSTSVAPVNLDGKEVEYSVDSSSVFPEKYIGKYKQEIIIENSDSFEKIGERFIEIFEIDGNNVKGRYYEVLNDEYKAKYDTLDFEFTTEKSKHYGLKVNYKDANGEQRNGVLHPSGNGKLYFEIYVEFNEDDGYRVAEPRFDNYDRDYIRVFE